MLLIYNTNNINGESNVYAIYEIFELTNLNFIKVLTDLYKFDKVGYRLYFVEFNRDLNISFLNSIAPDTLTNKWLNYYKTHGLIYNYHFTSVLELNYVTEIDSDNNNIIEGLKTNLKQLKLKGLNPGNKFYFIIFIDFDTIRLLL